MKKAFTLVELLFVIVIIAILTAIGFSSFKTRYSQKDAEFVLLKIKEARYNAMGNSERTDDGCIELTKEKIEKKETDDKQGSPYVLHATLNVKTLKSADNKICFDEIGRPYDGTSNSFIDTTYMPFGNLLQKNVDIELTHSSETCTIRLYKFSGYGIISCGN